MKKNVVAGIIVLTILICLWSAYLFSMGKKVETQKQGYIIGTGTTKLASASGAAF